MFILKFFVPEEASSITFISPSLLDRQMNKSVFLVIILLLSISAAAQTGKVYHLSLLAVQEGSEQYTGSEADLFLELKEGTGRVFLDTYPLTKMDTQISTRFAKDIACSHFKLDCKDYDFIYTIKSKSNIVGGPSAGAAIAALTTIAVLDLPYDDKVTITGTVNSGGIIGPVGGVKEKIEAASKAGLTKVLIPKGMDIYDLGAELNETNATGNASKVDLIQYGRQNLNLEVKEVIALDEVVFELTGKKLNNKEVDMSVNEEYNRIMQGLQEALCERTAKIRQEINGSRVKLEGNVSEQIALRQEKALNATKNGDYYSAASFCFGNNIQLKTQYYEKRKLSKGMVAKLFAAIEMKTSKLEEQLAEEKIETISDLQALMVVKERLNDVHQQLQAYEKRKAEPMENLYGLLAYTEERYYSAQSWMQFFAMEGRHFQMDEAALQRTCAGKIAEAEERSQYAGLYLGDVFLLGINEKIATAQGAGLGGDYPLCLITASQAKADANAILSSLGLSDEVLDDYLDSKSKAVEQIIAQNTAEGIFPILGYSYYRYADSLRASEKYTALVYLEYALEMSDLQMYFPEEETLPRFSLPLEWVLLGEGFIVGVVVTLLVVFAYRSAKKKNHWRR